MYIHNTFQNIAVPEELQEWAIVWLLLVIKHSTSVCQLVLSFTGPSTTIPHRAMENVRIRLSSAGQIPKSETILLDILNQD